MRLLLLAVLVSLPTAIATPRGAYFNPDSHHTSAVDVKGVRHQGSEYSGTPPWLSDRLRSVGPKYPHRERLYHHQGRGIVRLTLDVKTGLVTKATVIKSTGFPALGNSAVVALKQWTWKAGKWKEIALPVTFDFGSPLPREVPLSR